ncbi:MAG: DUF2142 domain-containing protein [Planctomycetota bacterium]|nr:DUF2142 domain-containing protein [Planctomycetota bacterium]
MLFVVITPPFQVADEPAHFYRAYQVSEGVIKGQRQQDVSGGLLPVSLASVSRQISGNIPFHPENKQEIGDLLRGLRMPLDRTERGFIPFVNTTIHTPLVYIPQAVGILFGRILSDSVLVLMYFGRLTNLIFWVALVYHAIKITPVFKYLFLVLALAPMSLFQAASLSADSLTNALSFLWIAVCLMFSCQRCTPIKKRELCMLLILSVMVSLSKQVYLILVFLVFLIPSDKFGGKRNKWRASLTLIVLSLVCSAGWLYSIRDIYVPFRDGIQIQTQLHFILSSPFKYAEILLGTFREQWWLLPAGYIGILGWLDTPLLLWQYPYYTVLFIAVALSERSVECLFSLKNRVLIFFVFLAGVILIFTSQYLSWTLPKASLIEGLQGRYFIPVCPLLLMLLYNQKISQIKVLNKFVFPVKMGFYLSITVSLICTIAVVIKRYY